jgi:hypothetical protein
VTDTVHVAKLLLTQTQSIALVSALDNAIERLHRHRAEVAAPYLYPAPPGADQQVTYSVGDMIALIDDLHRAQIRIAALATRIRAEHP